MKILIADDDSTSRAVLSGVLKKFGHEPVETTNGLDALALLQERDGPCLAILDWMMPGMDGLEVVRTLRADPPKAPRFLIMLTARGEKADIVTGLEAGASDYLSKPFDPGELRARIQVGCELVQTRKALDQKIEELEDALEQIHTLQGILPICSCCKKIRDDQGYWQQVEVYIRKHSRAQFSHGICPDCMKTYYPDIDPEASGKHTPPDE